MQTWRRHWREYFCEALCLGLFMLSAAFFATFFQHPSSPFVSGSTGWVSRLPMAAAMGLTAISLIYSPAGRRSGAHMNPAVTLAYLRLRTIAPADAGGYVVAQFVGGTLGLLAALGLLGGLPAHATVNYVATVPGAAGSMAAFASEAAISALLMAAVLVASNRKRAARYTGVLAGALVAAYIVVEAPVSGMSMNPARTFAANVLAGRADTLWLYFSAPPLGMLGAAEVWIRLQGYAAVRCAKLHHSPHEPCLFRCGYASTRRSDTPRLPLTGAEAAR